MTESAVTPRTPIFTLGALANIDRWHKLARPVVTDRGFNVQLGCHLEEVVEMLDSLLFSDTSNIQAPRQLGNHMAVREHLHCLAESLKSGQVTADIFNRKEFADSIGDQIVTVVGAGHCARMDTITIAQRVDASNWSKFVNGVPVFDANGKIAKGPGYFKPDLSGTY